MRFVGTCCQVSLSSKCYHVPPPSFGMAKLVSNDVGVESDVYGNDSLCVSKSGVNISRVKPRRHELF